MSNHIVLGTESYAKALSLIKQLHKHLNVDNPQDTLLIRIIPDESIDLIQSVPTYTHPDGEVLMIRHLKNQHNDGLSCL